MIHSTALRAAAAAVACCALAAGPAAADPPPGSPTPSPKPAAQNTLPNISVPMTTPDGWVIKAEVTNIKINPVPNLAATAFTRQAFWNATSTGDISGQGKSPVTGATVKMVMQTGCQIDISEGLGMGVSPNPTVSVPSPSYAGSPTFSISTTLKPGMIKNITISERKLEGNRGWLMVNRGDLSVDACMGPVTVRLVTAFTVGTKNGEVTTYAYSKPFVV